jgi:hypothetical protein
MSGSWTQRDDIALVEDLCDLAGGESFWLRVSMIGGGGPCPLSIRTLAFVLQLRKITENLSQGAASHSDLFIPEEKQTLGGRPVRTQ